jgi:hypothetical protein
MQQSQTGRLIVIRGTVAPNVAAGHRSLTGERAMPQRIVVIRNGQLVGRRPGR